MNEQRNWITFQNLKPGERFRFHYYPTSRIGADVFTKRNAQWFEDWRGRKFRTGKFTAVKREQD